MLIDTHTHLDSEAYEHDVAEVIARAKAAGVQRFIIPGADLATLPRAIALAERFDEVFFASGVHPYDIAALCVEQPTGGGTAVTSKISSNGAEAPGGQMAVTGNFSSTDLTPVTSAASATSATASAAITAAAEAEFSSASLSREQLLRSLSRFDLAGLEHPKCLAIGECGLDYFRKPSPAEKIAQELAFRRQCEIACERELPIILHVRDASEDVAAILRDYPALRGEFHCFNASPLLLEFAERFYYGIGGVCTFKNAKNLVQILPQIPPERLLIETDAPYLTPHPHRGSRNESAYCALICERIAEILGKSSDFIAELASANSAALFGAKLMKGAAAK